MSLSTKIAIRPNKKLEVMPIKELQFIVGGLCCICTPYTSFRDDPSLNNTTVAAVTSETIKACYKKCCVQYKGVYWVLNGYSRNGSKLCRGPM